MAFRLLLVDDHKLTLELTKDLLEKNGYIVDTASSREMGLRLVKERGDQYALFILDYLMGDENGADMAKDLQRLLNRKDDSQYGLAFVAAAEATRMVGSAKRLLGRAQKAVQA